VKRLALTELGNGERLLGDRAGLDAALARALSTLWLAAQPIVRAADGTPFAHEVLVRSREALLPTPGSLFDAADRLGTTATLGRHIRRHAAEILARSASATLFVNVVPGDLLDDDLFHSSAPLSPHAARVVLEITERASLERVPDARVRIERLRALGYRLALDDLGAGYAGLSSFAILEPEITKLDMSLIRDLDTQTVKQRLVRSLTAVCHDLGSSVVAEGVETAAERDAAVSLGCDLIQGYFVGRPAPWEAD
jgi:EAL domain-containing protein (putative c-di-GMP-specific phosphodiesterase class I)